MDDQKVLSNGEFKLSDQSAQDPLHENVKATKHIFLRYFSKMSILRFPLHRTSNCLFPALGDRFTLSIPHRFPTPNANPFLTQRI
jgi:hypothetical protein